MTKTGLLARICDQLETDLRALSEAAQATYDGATDVEAKAENKYDTRALEASYLAGAQARRAGEAKDALLRYRTLTVADFSTGRAIAVSALVKLDCNGDESWYFLGPCSGGLKVQHEGATVMIVTPSAPLGKRLLGQEEGDSVVVGAREYEIVEVL